MMSEDIVRGLDHRYRIQKRMQFLVKNINADGRLINELYAEGALSWGERISIADEKLTMEEKAERLLIYMSKAAVKHYKLFVKLLPKDFSMELDKSPTTGALSDCSVSDLRTRVLKCHNVVKDVDSLDIRVRLYEHGRISFGDYKAHFIDTKAPKAVYCESLMHLLYNYGPDMKKDPEEIEKNLKYFRHALKSEDLQGKYLAVVDKIDSVDLKSNSYGYSNSPKFVTNFNTLTGVRGLAILEKKLYAVLHKRPEVHVLELDNSCDQFTLKTDHITQIEGLRWPSDIVADFKHGLLFISNKSDEPGIISLDPRDDSNPMFQKLMIGDLEFTPAGMSMTPRDNLLVAYEKKAYDKDGKSRYGSRGLAIFQIAEGGQLTHNRTIDLSNFERYILQPVMLPKQGNGDELYVFSQLHKHNANLHRICKVNSAGDIKAKPYGGNIRSMWPSVRSPWGVMIDPLSNPGENRLLVSNCHEHKIVLLSDQLEYLQDVVNPDLCSGTGDVKFICPRCMCFDKESGFLYVGQRWKQDDGKNSSVVSGAISVFQISKFANGQI